MSLQVGVAATAIGLALAVPASLAIARRRFRGRAPINTLLLMPLVVPGVVLGTSIYVFQIETEMRRASPPRLGARPRRGPCADRDPLGSASRDREPVGVRSDDRGGGEEPRRGPWTTFRRVTLPAIRPGIVAGAMFGFVMSFGNLEMSLFLVGAGRTTLPIAILQYLEWKIDPTVAAASVMQIALIGAAMLITDRYVKISPGRVMARLELRDLSALRRPLRRQQGQPRRRRRRVPGPARPSGCGKTTTLRMVAGFVEPSGGAAHIGGVDVTYLPPWRRNTGMVFQSYALSRI